MMPKISRAGTVMAAASILTVTACSSAAEEQVSEDPRSVLPTPTTARA